MIENPVFKLTSFRVPESNVFFMTRFRKTDYHQAISDAVAEAVRAFGLELVRADDPNLAGAVLWTKVQFCMEACHFGVAVFEDIDEGDLNPNVSLELGYMMARERTFLLLKERRLPKLPTDLCGHLYKEFDSFDIRPTVLGRVAEWLKPTGARKLDNEKLVIVASYGGTDRCAIAKAISDHLLDQNQFPPDYRIASRAAFNISGAAAAKSGIEVVQQRLGKDLLGNHRPRRAGVALLFEADLILATDTQVLSKLRESSRSYPGSDVDKALVRDEIHEKTYLLSEFFGRHGDIEDPYPDRQDTESKRKYEKCFDDLYVLISGGLPRLIDFLERDRPSTAKLRTVNFGDHRLYGTEQA
jgi:protein-tyrosine-phosphatase